ncbi:MOSC domain-containing protein [Mobilicoccus pelagius]|uniref:MOSC domain-containing protein n=1 Tax=Mobilicoccus pelagius NBRC 104925 TaxID=1089455 RepID=H5UMG9_9MICO|nr:MOSC N-terminal beta barrel domain-containing protein [Mobilicoccus pelagius]GAB46927.1 hypothetical protein MOPEL_001_00450 [Mobilicoccus pelagius NBRC 104925]
MGVRVTAIGIHPVKSTAIRRVARAEVTAAGLRGDREWMVVDDSGEMVSARQEPRLFTVCASTPATGDTAADLRLEAPGVAPLDVAYSDEGDRDVRLFRRTHLVGRPAGEAADAWLQRALGRDDLHLVRCAEPQPRRSRSGVERMATFQDGYPVTLLSEESVVQVDAWAAEAARARGEEPVHVDARRFRPNVLVSGAEAAFAEDDWERMRIGDVVLRRASLVARCVMTTIDPDDLGRGKDPIRTLAAHRRWDGSTWLAVNLVPEQDGVIAVGDDVEPL